ncbi:hypothetical protein [Flavobacterium sp. KACC 22761]|uniref:hypothetical protein n=1 Tax=Flavobacterium sp. KACC 22761 TaxID=3092665 RepID=UPI002A75F91C|nr:hypothetical protein [Flavobacterium sp. KACC 22761]WPO77531.1 hypothetical protein SCB73_14775 [Flavobacterium sp. KACC 22761]
MNIVTANRKVFSNKEITIPIARIYKSELLFFLVNILFSIKEDRKPARASKIKSKLLNGFSLKAAKGKIATEAKRINATQ